jgi:hypothetical protein
MIRIKFTEPTTRVWKRWIKECKDATALLVAASGAISITDLYRRKSIKSSVYLAKDGPFRGRCAYCDSYIADFQHGDMEHFRPKKAVTNDKDEPVMIVDAASAQKDHPGYYWLAYSWSNLVPSCITCNQPGEDGIGKRNRFPVAKNKYATTPEEIQDETPLLFNPIDPDDEDPEDHIGIDFKTGLLIARNGSPRAESCIKIFGLNIRDQLVQERKSALSEIKAKCTELLYADEARVPQLRQEVLEMTEGQLNHTLARRAQFKAIRNRFGL